MVDLIERAAELLRNAQHVVCTTGAGVSAESGVSTFRDAETGHWTKFNPEELASQRGFAKNPGLVWRWYMERLYGSTVAARPNPGHAALAQLEKMVPQFTLITQNVDNLHEQAGSTDVIHLHGNISLFYCNVCRAEYDLLDEDRTADEPPRCPVCTGMIRPGVVWFGEQLPVAEINRAWQAAESCDLMLVVGTSGVVYPAAHIPALAKEHGAQLIDVNPEQDAIAPIADLFLQRASGEILPQVLAAMASG